MITTTTFILTAIFQVNLDFLVLPLDFLLPSLVLEDDLWDKQHWFSLG